MDIEDVKCYSFITLIISTVIILLFLVGSSCVFLTVRKYQEYKDSIYCKETTGIYSCQTKAIEHTNIIKVR